MFDQKLQWKPGKKVIYLQYTEKKKQFLASNSIPSKISFKNQGEIKTFSDKQNTKRVCHQKKEILKDFKKKENDSRWQIRDTGRIKNKKNDEYIGKFKQI